MTNRDRALSMVAYVFVSLGLLCSLGASYYNGKVMGEASLGVAVFAPARDSVQWAQKLQLRGLSDGLFYFGVAFALLGLVTEAFSLFSKDFVSKQASNDESRNRARRLCLAIIYFVLGITGCLLCLFWQGWSFLPIPSEIGIGASRRLLWCIGWSFIGFSTVAAFSVKTESGKKDPFPSYLHFYPLSLLINSLLILGLLQLFDRTTGFLFYPLAAWLGFNLGFWVDVVRFDHILEAAMKKVSRT